MEMKGSPEIMSIARVAAFHTYDDLTAELRRIEQARPELIRMAAIGKTRAGRDLWCLEAANREAATPVAFRPGLLVIANMHAVELAGSCQALHFLSHLVEHYDDDAAVRRLLDEQVVYVIPRIAIDGADHILAGGWRVRSRHIEARVRNAPYPSDLNGDGKVLKMRWPCLTGGYRLSTKDPRLVVPRRPEDAEGPFYELADEGPIHEWDGGRVSGSQPDCDFNRNFPAADWRPTPWLPEAGASAHGAYPLSEPETRAVVDFVLAHPNIAAAADFHTGNPAVFYPRQTIKGSARHAADAELIERMGKRAEAVTGWPLLSSYVELRTGVRQSETAGGAKDWLYERLGVPVLLFEMGMFYNYLGFTTQDYFKLGDRHAEETGLALLAAHDADPAIGLFTDWTPFDHPQLGPVEIGGWNTVPWSNPPLKNDMEAACDKGTRFLLEFAQWRSRLQITALTAEPLGGGLFLLKAQVANMGTLPTCLTEQGREAFQGDDPTVELAGDIACVTGRMNQRLGHLAAHGGSARLEWVVRAGPGTLVAVTVTSRRGAYAQARLELPGR